MNRIEIINHLIERHFPYDCKYLEIGVRNRSDCFNHIKASVRMCVDPGTEQDTPDATFVYTSDDFFQKLRADEIEGLSSDYKWNVIFIDGLHLADQVWRDILNSIRHLTQPGFVVLHDVSPEHWFSAHSDYDHYLTHGGWWNGTVWKAFYRARTELPYNSYTVNTDQGIGIIETHTSGEHVFHNNIWYEYGEMNKDRRHSLGLISIDEFLEKHI